MSSDCDWDNGDDMVKVKRTRPLSLKEIRQSLIEAAEDNFGFDAQLEILEEKRFLSLTLANSHRLRGMRNIGLLSMIS